MPNDTDQSHHMTPTGFVRRGLSSNIWLFFLLFPGITIGASDMTTTRKIIAIGLIVLFAVVHMVAFDEEFRREMGMEDAPSRDRAPRWFALLVAIVVATLAIGGWAALGVVPFLVSFAMFHFPWRIVIAVVVASLAVTIVGPALSGVLTDLWFFILLVGGVTAATALIRIEEQYKGERHAFETSLAVSDERNRVARDVHDVLGHSLTAVILKAQVCDRLLQQLEDSKSTGATPDPSRDQQLLATARKQLAELDTVSRRALSEIRSTVGGLRSADLGDELTAARAVLADAEVGLTVVGDVSGLDAEMRTMLGWVVREGVTNIVRHARASNCRIELGGAAGDPAVLLRLIDDGVGLREAVDGTSLYGNGLNGLRERVASHGAELQTLSQEGTVIEVRTDPRARPA